MSAHLRTRERWLCGTSARWPATSTALGDVTCTRCLSRIERARVYAAYVAHERALRGAQEADARRAGLGAVYDFLADDDSPTSRMMLGIVGALGTYLVEQGCTVLRDSA